MLFRSYLLDGKAVLNDQTATPGAIDASLTTAVLCDKAYHTSQSRNVTLSQKKMVCKMYGITTGCPGKGYEIDHLISIELGGSNDTSNLWPQPVDTAKVVGFHTKDVVENRAHKAVCAGKITLQEAQEGISTDWYKFGLSNGFISEAIGWGDSITCGKGTHCPSNK